MKLHAEHGSDSLDAPPPIPFPLSNRSGATRMRLVAPSISRHQRTAHRLPVRVDDADVLAAFTTVSRRMEDLARELKCLGHFEEDSDRPRAA